jgi:drug/metabolite transporter (DMT)-like permease
MPGLPIMAPTRHRARLHAPASAWLSWLTISVGWGLTYRWMADGAAWCPLVFIVARHVTGGVLLTVLGRLAGERSLAASTTSRLLLVGVLMWAAGNGALIWSLQPGGLDDWTAAVMVSGIPLVTTVLAGSTASGRRATRVAVAALVVGAIGTWLMVPDAQPGSATQLAWSLAPRSPAIAILGLMLGVTAWSYGSVLLSRTSLSAGPLLPAGRQMLGGGLALAIVLLGALTAGFQIPQPSTDVVIALAAVTLVGSVLCPACYAHAVKHLPVTVVSLHAYINPIVAVAIAVLFRRTALTAQMIAGAAIVLSAVAIASRTEQQRHTASTTVTDPSVTLHAEGGTR